MSEALRAQWRWARRPRRYLPGPSHAGTGYVVLATAVPAEALVPELATSASAERGELWDL